jgi:cardiolipin synthase
MKKAGIELRFFLPIVESILRGRANLRNHRKLILIDNKHALIGGMNISSTYLGPKINLKRWVDLNIEVSGNCVADLRTIFEADWSFSDKK